MLGNDIDARLRRDHGLPLGSLNAMMIIDSTPQRRVYDIAHALAITVGGTSQAVSTVSKRPGTACGWPTQPTADRRSFSSPTPAKTLLGEAIVTFDDELDRLIRAPISDSALTHLSAALHALRHAATTPAPTDASRSKPATAAPRS